jgi:hypothetical protein
MPLASGIELVLAAGCQHDTVALLSVLKAPALSKPVGC